MTLTDALFDRHGEIRSGWRIVLFMVATLTAGAALLWPLMYLPRGLSALESLAVLLAASVGTWVMTRFVNRKPFTAVGLRGAARR